MKICLMCGKSKEENEFHLDVRKGKSKYTNWCEDCHKEYHHEYYLRNKEKILKKASEQYENNKESQKAYSREWQKNNRDKRIIITRRWRKNNREYVVSSSREYKKAHPDKVTASSERRRAKIMGNGGTVSDKEWKDILDKYGNICLRCGRNDVKLMMDHIIPINLGGRHSVENIQPLCQSCNSIKYLNTTDYRSFI
jgi:5-methylcytosine-specific restriction endonuclease McrA